MRFPEVEECLVGKVCICSVGRLFIVTHQKAFDWGLVWAGLGLDGKGIACSSNPCIIAESGHEFYDKLSKRFGGKMSFND
jgi:hypothetical protein